MIDKEINIIKNYVKEYMEMLKLDSFPKFEVENVKIVANYSLAKELPSFDEYGNNIKETLYFPIQLLYMDSNKYLFFHEFTHIQDSYNLSEDIYIINKGYTEYHASQIEMLPLLNIKKDNIISFSMNTQINASGNVQTVKDYLIRKKLLVDKLFNITDFKNYDSVCFLVGVIFDYFGNLSFCEMYARDFINDIDISNWEIWLGNENIKHLTNTLHGWINDERKKYELRKMYVSLVGYLLKKVNKN